MTFSERSEQRFQKVSGAIRKLFAADAEAGEEAIELAKQMLTHARAEAIAKAASEVGVDSEFKDVFAAPHDEEIIRPTLTREITAGNPWVHGADFEKLFRRTEMQKSAGVADFGWDSPVTLTKTEHHYSPYLTEGIPFAKGEIASRLYRMLDKMRPALVGNEEELLTKAIRSLDVAAFAEISEGVFDRRGIKLPVGA